MDKKWWTLIAVGAGTFMLLLDVTIVTVAQPGIQSGLHAGFTDVQWVLAAYALTLAAFLLTSGVLADRYGRKRLFQIGLVIFTLGSLLCGVAQDPLMLILSRSGQGIGGGITTNWSWRGIFLVNVPIGVIAVAVTAWRVEESRSPHPHAPDWAGFALLTTGLVGLVYGLIRAGENSWSDTGVITCLAVAVVALAGFVVAEQRVAYPMFDLSLLRVTTFLGGSIAAFAMNGSLYAVLLYLVIYLQDILGCPAQDAGLRLAIISGAQFVTATLAGRVSARVPARWLIGPGLLFVGIGLVVMAGLSGGSSWTHLIPGFIVAGLGGGLVNPPLASTAIGVVPPHQAGMASGVSATFRQIGIATGIAALGSIFTAAMPHNLAHSPPVAASAPRIVALVRQGEIGRLFASTPPAARGQPGPFGPIKRPPGRPGTVVRAARRRERWPARPGLAGPGRHGPGRRHRRRPSRPRTRPHRRPRIARWSSR